VTLKQTILKGHKIKIHYTIQNIMTKILPLLTLLFISIYLNAQQVTEHRVEPKGIYSNIDVSKSNLALQTLVEGNIEEQNKIATELLNNPNAYNPTALYALSAFLFRNNRKEEACFWFYVAQLRARFDANLCLDNSAKSGVAVLNQTFGPQINEYIFKDIEQLKNIVKKVVEFVKSNEEKYDHRWLALHGMNAMMAGLDEDDVKSKKNPKIIEPETKWAEIKEKTITDYYNGFLDAMKNLNK
jgi:hypothetical protein